MDQPTPRSNLTDRTRRGIRDVLEGRQRGWGAALPFFGPAIVTSIAYIDPGNFATNIQAGARYGYSLLWVVVLANLVAMLFQALSAKLGIATGSNLAELCRDRLPRGLTIAMWIVSEVAAMATDLAEFLGGAIGFALLLGVPLFAGLILTAIATCAILALERGGFRPVELVIGSLVAVIALCYLFELFVTPVHWGEALRSLRPSLPDGGALTLAVGIIGATVMPHAIYLHSSLTKERTPVVSEQARRQLVRYSNREVLIALSLAGLVNMAMVVMAANAFHDGLSQVAEIESAYHSLGPLLGSTAATVFLVSLTASGISSSTVGTMAGQMIMQGFVGFRIPLWLRRGLTMIPPFIVIGFGVDPTRALVLSQVLLSLTLPVPMIALLAFTGQSSLMGRLVNHPLTMAIAVIAAAIVLLLNLVLLGEALDLPIPGLPRA